MKIRFSTVAPAQSRSTSRFLSTTSPCLEQFLKSEETAPVHIQFDVSPANLRRWQSTRNGPSMYLASSGITARHFTG